MSEEKQIKKDEKFEVKKEDWEAVVKQNKELKEKFDKISSEKKGIRKPLKRVKEKQVYLKKYKDDYVVGYDEEKGTYTLADPIRAGQVIEWVDIILHKKDKPVPITKKEFRELKMEWFEVKNIKDDPIEVEKGTTQIKVYDEKTQVMKKTGEYAESVEVVQRKYFTIEIDGEKVVLLDKFINM